MSANHFLGFRCGIREPVTITSGSMIKRANCAADINPNKTLAKRNPIICEQFMILYSP